MMRERILMQKALILIVLATLLASSLSGLAQDAETDATEDADACVAAAVEDLVLPQTLDELLTLRDALDEVIAQCSPSQTMYINSPGAGRANVRSAPELSAEIVAKLIHGESVEVHGEVEGDEFGGSASWFELRVDDEEAYVHSQLLSETEPVPVAPERPTSVQGISAAPQSQVTWHEGNPPNGTCKDNIRDGRIYLGCDYDEYSNVHRDLAGLECNHPAFDAFGYGPARETDRGSHERNRDGRVSTSCASHN